MSDIIDGLRIENDVVMGYAGGAEELTLPSDVKKIAPHAFDGCKNLKKIITAPGLRAIGDGAFYGCDSLEEVTIPGAIFREVATTRVFTDCSKIYFRFFVAYADDDYEEEEADSDTLAEKMAAIIPKEKPNAAESADGEVTIGEYIIRGDRVIRYIGHSTVTCVPKDMRVIGEGAFSNSGVQKVVLPDSVTDICKDAFAWCVKLNAINLPQNLKLIDDGAFADCQSLEEIEFPQSLKFIGADAFRACSALKKAALPPSLLTIGRRAFDFCVSLTRADIPENVTEISEGAFSHCESIEKVTLPPHIKGIDAWAFAECASLRDISFPDGLQGIGDVAFLNCRSLVAFDLPFSLRVIGRQAFAGCAALSLANIPAALRGQVTKSRSFYRIPASVLHFVEEEGPPPQGA